jgi:molecular chaperone GrpE
MPKNKKQDQDTKNLETQLARALADYQNLEKRYERDSSHVVKFANAALLGSLLDFRDHLQLSSQNLSDPSLTMLLTEFDKIMLEEGVEEIDTSGEFDPSLMECAELVPGEKDRVVAVVRPGFRLHERILRPARVQVGMGQPEPVKK